MTIDACVFCNCYETGKMRVQPPQPDLVFLEESGQLSLRWDQPGANQNRFYHWLAVACEHGPLGELVSHQLGNTDRLGFLREVLGRRPDHFPTFLNKVVHDGIRPGHYLDRNGVEQLASEMVYLHDLRCVLPGDERMLRDFESQLGDLIQASRSVEKPIVFV